MFLCIFCETREFLIFAKMRNLGLSMLLGVFLARPTPRKNVKPRLGHVFGRFLARPTPRENAKPRLGHVLGHFLARLNQESRGDVKPRLGMFVA